MKKIDRLKTIQLICFIALTVLSAVVICVSKGLYHTIAADPGVKIMCGMLWLTLVVSFVFIFLDFNSFGSFKRDYRELDYAVHSDPVAGIANRYSSDSMIEKYLDKPIPEGLGCIMIVLSNIQEINQLYGHIAGNQMIRDFSTILKFASVNLCFAARNGGNKFLVLFEECSDEKIEKFLARVSQKVGAQNSQPGTHPIEYKYGIAFNENENVKTITDLIALSDRRIKDETVGR